VRLRKGDRTDAAQLMKEYVAARPKDASGYYLLGAALHSLNQFSEARAALERSQELRPDTDTEYLLGVTRYDAGDRAGAIETLRRVVQARPEFSSAHTALGTAYRDEGNIEAARASLERAVALDPNDLRAHYQLGLVYGKLGERDAAKKMLDRAEVLRGEQRARETVRLKLVDPPQE
jgi:Flp pilus assembly protein TadD